MQGEKTDPATSGFRYVKGPMDLFYFFSDEKSRDYASQALNFFLHNAKRHDESHPIFKRIIRNLYDESGGMEEHIEHFFIKPEDHINSEYKDVDFEYLRILEGSYVDSVEMVDSHILRVKTRIGRIMRINPFTRFFRQFNTYVGLISQEARFFAPNGTVSPQHRGLAGLRTMEKILLSIFQKKDGEIEAGIVDLIELIIDIMEDNRFVHHDDFLLLILRMNLKRKLLIRAMKAVQNTDRLLPLYQDSTGWMRKEIRFLLEDEQIESLHKRPRSREHPEFPAIDVEGVKEQLRKIFPKRRNYDRFIDRLAVTMHRVRENKYSTKTKAPEGYVAALVHTVPGVDGRKAMILPGQDPLVIKPVASNQQLKEDMPLGSVFVVWIAKNTVNTLSYVYQSKSKNLFYIKIHH